MLYSYTSLMHGKPFMFRSDLQRMQMILDRNVGWITSSATTSFHTSPMPGIRIIKLVPDMQVSHFKYHNSEFCSIALSLTSYDHVFHVSNIIWAWTLKQHYCRLFLPSSSSRPQRASTWIIDMGNPQQCSSHSLAGGF